MEYHVLSNNSLISFLFYGVMAGMALGAVFSYLGQRDSSIVTKEKSIIRKTIPWVILCIFFSELSLLLYRYFDYPWDLEPQPSQASAFREMNYLGSGYPLWGWANDYQLPIVSALAGSIMWLCWTVYAFNFKPSDTSWWKKVCKVVAYFILSATILGFYIHELRDIWLYVGVIVVITILLWLAKVKVSPKENSSPREEIMTNSNEEAPHLSEQKDNEDPLRFMPKSSIVLPPEPTDNIETPSINEPEVSESVSQENVIPQQIQVEEEVITIKEEEVDFHQQPADTVEKNEMMYCKHCGKRIEADSTFCKYCGRRLK